MLNYKQNKHWWTKDEQSINPVVTFSSVSTHLLQGESYYFADQMKTKPWNFFFPSGKLVIPLTVNQIKTYSVIIRCLMLVLFNPFVMYICTVRKSPPKKWSFMGSGLIGFTVYKYNYYICSYQWHKNDLRYFCQNGYCSSSV